MASLNVDDIVSILSSNKFTDALQRPELHNAIHKLTSPSSEYVTLWILIATAAVAAVSGLLVWLQLRADHERSRRELAVNLLREWTTSQEIETASAIRLVRLLNTEQCTKLAGRESFQLDYTTEHLELVLACLEYRFPKIKKDKAFKKISGNTPIYVNSTYAAYIRFRAVGYLNLLEAIMASWYESVAKPNIIEGQFRFLRSGREADLATLRDALEKINNADPFPCITKFVENMQPRYGRRPGFADAWPFRLREREPE
jgi:hypothetical protein